MNAPSLYHDTKIVCDDEKLTIYQYYFPFGGAKEIPYRDIKGIEVYTMGLLTGKLKTWGGTFTLWLNLDLRRPWKDQAIILRLGRVVAPVITPDDVPAVVRILEQKTSLKARTRPSFSGSDAWSLR
ncbi:MAG: hypothetical protein ABSD29_08910 [Verrucomicrobiota bacterium]|jgi:hypothetical protein